MSNILTKHLTGQGQTWHKFLSSATFAYNIFYSPNLGNYSPYELIFRREPKILLDLETDPDIKVSSTFKDYHTLLTKRLKYLQNMPQNFKMKCVALINKDREYFQYNTGDLVYLISPLNTIKNKFQKSGYKICWPFGHLQNCRSSQLLAHDNRW